MGDSVLLTIDPESAWFAAGTEKWHGERESLRADLERELGPGAVRQSAPRAGDKGLPLVAIVVALAGGRAFESLARCFDSWLKNRPGERTVTVTGTLNGQEQSIRVTADNASIDALQPFIQGLGDVLK
jgi:hypothetical protein